MATASFYSLRRIWAGIVMLMLICVCSGQKLGAQTPTITASSVSGLTHPSGWGKVTSVAVTTYGDVLAVDYANGALYEFPADGSAVKTLLAAGSLASWSNAVLAVDSQNALYLSGNWSNCLLRFPYDATSKSWTGLSAYSPSHQSSNCDSPFVQYNLSWSDGEWGIQPYSLSFDASGNMLVGILKDDKSGFAAYIPISRSGSTATPLTPTIYAYALGNTPLSMASDPYGNVYMALSVNPGVYEMPAGTHDVSGYSSFSRVDPGLSAVTGVTTDAAGNLYISDSSAGLVYVPAATSAGGAPQSSSSVLLASIPAGSAAVLDLPRHLAYVPLSSGSTWNGIYDVAKVNLNYEEFGATPVGTPVAQSVYLTFAGAATPATIQVLQAGSTTPDFSVGTGGSCAAGTAYAAGSTCTVSVNFSPLHAGNATARLIAADGAGNELASLALHGTGQAAMVAFAPSLESTIGSNLNSPSQVAVDAAGNTFVADAGQGAVLEYAAGSTTAPVSIGTGLTAPTGVAVDGSGNVFIADSGKVYEVPRLSSGLSNAAQVTLKTGLGTNLNLAVDGLGTLYIADPNNAQVVQLRSPGVSFAFGAQTETLLSGFTAPAYVAADAAGTLYVVDGNSLYEVSSDGTQTTLSSSLSSVATGINGISVDASSALYLGTGTGPVRVPYVSGTWDFSATTKPTSSITNGAGVAVDSVGNLYTADLGAGNLRAISINGDFNFGTLGATDTPSQSFTLTNQGNAALTITDFVVSDATDYAVSGTACTSASIASGSTCSLTLNLTPGAGQQGTLSTTVQATGNEANGSTQISATAVGPTLLDSTTSVSITTGASVTSVPVVITVSPKSGTGTATGQVSVSVDGGATAGTASLSNGTATITLAPVAAGSHSFAVTYQGDRTYAGSSASTSATIAQASVIFTESTPQTYILSSSAGEISSDSYTQTYLKAQMYVVTVGAAAGTPTGTVTFMEGSSYACSSQTSAQAKVASDGTATFDPSCLTIPSGTTPTTIIYTHTLTPVYSGDSNFETYTGSPITFTVIRNPSVTLASSPTSISVQAGSTASATITLTSVDGYGISGSGAQIYNYTLPLKLECADLPPHATCSFSSSSINVTPDTPGSATVTIQTNVSTGTQTAANHTSRMMPVAYAAFFGLGMFGLFAARRRGMKYLAVVCILLLGGTLTGLTACSTTTLSSSSSDSLKTPAGTYAVTVTAIQTGSVTVSDGNSTKVIVGSNNQISLPFTVNVTVQ